MSTGMGQIQIQIQIHPFLIVKRQFGCARCRYRGLAKNASMLTVLFALANVAMWSRAGCPELPACPPA